MSCFCLAILMLFYMVSSAPTDKIDAEQSTPLPASDRNQALNDNNAGEEKKDKQSTERVKSIENDKKSSDAAVDSVKSTEYVTKSSDITNNNKQGSNVSGESTSNQNKSVTKAPDIKNITIAASDGLVKSSGQTTQKTGTNSVVITNQKSSTSILVKSTQAPSKDEVKTSETTNNKASGPSGKKVSTTKKPNLYKLSETGKNGSTTQGNSSANEISGTDKPSKIGGSTANEKSETDKPPETESNGSVPAAQGGSTGNEKSVINKLTETVDKKPVPTAQGGSSSNEKSNTDKLSETVGKGSVSTAQGGPTGNEKSGTDKLSETAGKGSVPAAQGGPTGNEKSNTDKLSETANEKPEANKPSGKSDKGSGMLSKEQLYKDNKQYTKGNDDESYDEPSSGNFMAYFLTAVVLCVACYVLFHNKQKIVAFIIEGRNGGRRERRPKTSDYKKLNTSVDEVMPSLEKSTTSSKYVY